MNRSSMEHSAKMLKFAQFVRSRLALQQAAPAEHIDAGVLAAFAEQRLSANERANALMHLAHCLECREVLALLSAVQPEEVLAGSGPARRHFPLWVWCSTAAAALACLVLALIWPTSLIRHTTPQPMLVARTAAPPAPPMLLAPEIAKHSIPERPATGKQSHAKAFVPPHLSFRSSPHPQNEAIEPNRMLLEAEQSPAPQPADMILPPEMPKPPAARTLPFPGASAMFQAKSRIAPERVMIAARDTQQPANLWRLNGDPATLQKSNDGGMTWQTVRLDQGAPLYAISVAGPDIWVGGADATLLHSADGGVHWNKILIGDGNSRMTGPITRIESPGRYRLQVTTRSGEHWITTDGGLRWRRE